MPWHGLMINGQLCAVGSHLPSLCGFQRWNSDHQTYAANTLSSWAISPAQIIQIWTVKYLGSNHEHMPRSKNVIWKANIPFSNESPLCNHSSFLKRNGLNLFFSHILVSNKEIGICADPQKRWVLRTKTSSMLMLSFLGAWVVLQISPCGPEWSWTCGLILLPQPAQDYR